MAAALFQGASIGPLIELAIKFDPRYVSLTILYGFRVSFCVSCSFCEALLFVLLGVSLALIPSKTTSFTSIVMDTYVRSLASSLSLSLSYI